jgi:hypothetical protein
MDPIPEAVSTETSVTGLGPSVDCTIGCAVYDVVSSSMAVR